MPSIRMLFLVFCIPCSFGHTEEPCHPKYWTIKGTLPTNVRNYDDLLNSLAKSSDPTALINDSIRKNGLLVQLHAPKGPPDELTDYLFARGASGFNVGLFVRRMRVWKGVEALFSPVYEVANPQAKRPLRKWSLPLGANPLAVDGFRILYREKLVAVCREIEYEAVLRVTDEGNFEAVSRNQFAEPKPVSEADCTAQRTFFGNSKYATCMQFEDLTSKATHFLVWDNTVK